MEKKELKSQMDSLMKEAKQASKDMGKLLTGLKKKNRETEDYIQRVNDATVLQKKALSLIDEYQKVSKDYFKK